MAAPAALVVPVRGCWRTPLVVLLVAFFFLSFCLPEVASFSSSMFPPNYQRTKRALEGSDDRWRRLGVNSQDYDLDLFSPAKINLFLRVIRRREDGFHELASLFQTVSFGDFMLFKKLPEGAPSDELVCPTRNLPMDDTNLVIRALNLYRGKTGTNTKFKVFLDKRIPVQAGLGGGSSNAATTLFAANQLCGKLASEQQLIEWSGEIGSDITFFLSRGTAYCTGRGEIIEPLPPVRPLPLFIIKPKMGLSTPAVFKALNYDQLSTVDPRELLDTFMGRLLQGQAVPPESFVNDLEPPAFRVLPDLLEIKNEIKRQGFGAVMMSGSGSSIFAMQEPPTLKSGWGREFADTYAVKVWRARFTGRPRGEDEWYPDPSVMKRSWQA